MDVFYISKNLKETKKTRKFKSGIEKISVALEWQIDWNSISTVPSVSTWLNELAVVKIYYDKFGSRSKASSWHLRELFSFHSIPQVIPPVSVGGAEISTF